jgi:hypothetical protein
MNFNKIPLLIIKDIDQTSELNNYIYFNNYLSRYANSYILSNKRLQFSFYICKFVFRSNIFYLIISDYNDRIDLHYSYLICKFLNNKSINFTIIKKYTNMYHPYALHLCILYNINKINSSNLNEIFNEYKYKQHIRIIQLTNMNENEFLVKLYILYNDINYNIIDTNQLNQLYSNYLIKNYKK